MDGGCVTKTNLSGQKPSRKGAKARAGARHFPRVLAAGNYLYYNERIRIETHNSMTCHHLKTSTHNRYASSMHEVTL
jgi:hypothetical protein